MFIKLCVLFVLESVQGGSIHWPEIRFPKGIICVTECHPHFCKFKVSESSLSNFEKLRNGDLSSNLKDFFF